jgi:hypothetical protein
MRIDTVSAVEELPEANAPDPDELRAMVEYLVENGEPVPQEWAELLALADEFKRNA